MSQELIAEIDRVAGCWRRIALRTGVARTAAVAIGVATLLVLVDWIGRFDDAGLRWLASGLLGVAVAAAAHRAWRRLARLDASRLAVARRVEGVHPELGSRLASAVEFFDGDVDDPAAGSAELRRAVVVDAAARVERIDLDDAVDATPLRRAHRWALAAAACLAVLAAFAPAAVSTGLARLAMPWADVEWPRTNVLRLVDTPTAVAVGQPFEVAAVDDNGPLPDDVRIEYRFAASTDGAESPPVETAAMRIVGDQAVARREEVRRPFAFRVVGGDDRTMRWTDVAVVEPPRLDELRIRAEPPAYSGLPPRPVEGAIRVLEQTRLTVSGSAEASTAAAWIETPGEGRVVLAVAPQDDRARLSSAEEWLAEPVEGAGRSVRVALEGEDGLVGRGEPRPYEVVRDAAPTVAWRRPEGDLFLTARALAPISVAVEDDLAVRSVRLEAEATPVGESAGGDAAAPLAPLVLYEGPAEPPARESLGEPVRLAVEQDWDLSELSLEPGVRLDLTVVASDYRPSTGATELPRRVFIVTDEEAEERLAERQSRLLAEIERGLERQRSARDRSGALAIDAASGRPLDRGVLDRMTTLEFEQRQASAAIADPDAGAARLADDLLDALRRNRLDRPELARQLESVRDELADVAEGAMADARRDLAAARRATQRAEGSPDGGPVAEALADAERRQTEAVERLEAVAESLTGWADYQRFAGEIAQLRDKQAELSETTRRLAAMAAARDPLRAADLRVEQQKAVAAQAEIGRRFAKLRSGMQRLLADSPEEGDRDGAADAVADALAEADEAGVEADLREASRELARERLGRAGDPQDRAAEGLDRMLDALRRRVGGDPEQLIARLREAREQLDELRDRAERLEADDRPQERDDLAEDAQRMARGLERMTAGRAAESTRRGGDRVAENRPPPADAEQAFEQAQREVDQRIRELENQLAERMLDRLRGKIDGYIERQEAIVTDTRPLVDDGPAAAAAALGDAQGALETEVRVSGEEVAARRVFELALRATADEMADAAGRIADGLIDRSTVRLEESALARLRRVAEVLRSTPPPPPEDEGGQQGGGGGQGGESPPPSPIDVAELKMLRLMQLDLIDKTEAFEAEAGRAARETRPLAGDWRADARRLSAEQRGLVELALEMARRNNDPDAAPTDEP